MLSHFLLSRAPAGIQSAVRGANDPLIRAGFARDTAVGVNWRPGRFGLVQRKHSKMDGAADDRYRAMALEPRKIALRLPSRPMLEQNPAGIFLMSSHTPVSERELLDRINPEIQRHEGFKDVEIKGVNRLREPDLNGNNWTVPYARATGVPRQILYPVLDQVIRKAKTRFNLSAN